ncbi:MAG: YdgA family protein [Azonexus sp.]|jgi:uncharacterized protein YdgA (DUF945 family)|nr:YdgA family protein [Azonexus sp.]
MKKSVMAGGAVVVLAAAYAGGAWYTGTRLEAEIPAQVEKLNQTLSESYPMFGIKVEQLSYERGFFSSHARYGVAVAGLAEGAQPWLPGGAVEFDLTIEHGPFPLGALKRGSVTPQMAYSHAELVNTATLKPLFDMAGGQTPLTSDGIFAYGGGSQSWLSIAPLRLEKDGNKIDFSGLTLQGSYAPANQAVEVTTPTAASLMLDFAATPDHDLGQHLRFEGMALNSATRLGQSKLTIGKTELLIKQIVVAQSATPAFKQLTISDLREAGEIVETGDTVGIDAIYQVGGVKVDDINLGKGQLAFKLAGLNGEALYKLAQTYQTYAWQAMPETASTDDANDANDANAADASAAAMLEQFATAFNAALVGSPSLSITPQWQTEAGEGRITATVNLTQLPESSLKPEALALGAAVLLPAIKSAEVKAALSSAMMQELAARIITLQGTPPAEAASKAEQNIRMMVGTGLMMGLVRNENNQIVSDFSYADGKMLLNGKDPAESFRGLFNRDQPAD